MYRKNNKIKFRIKHYIFCTISTDLNSALDLYVPDNTDANFSEYVKHQGQFVDCIKEMKANRELTYKDFVLKNIHDKNFSQKSLTSFRSINASSGTATKEIEESFERQDKLFIVDSHSKASWANSMLNKIGHNFIREKLLTQKDLEKVEIATNDLKTVADHNTAMHLEEQLSSYKKSQNDLLADAEKHHAKRIECLNRVVSSESSPIDFVLEQQLTEMPSYLGDDGE